MLRAIKAIPLVKETRRYFQRLEYNRRFPHECYGCFWGVFETFEQAIQSAPKTKPIGYDNDELAQEYVQMLESGDWEHSQQLLRSYDYPVLFWLDSIFDHYPDSQVFDFGGNVGIHFYTYRKFLNLDQTIWMVCDLPSIVNAGKAIAKKREVNNLLFTTSLQDASKADVFTASGSIQYVNSLSESINQLSRKPKHILINRLPLYEGKQFVTLQNGGKVFYAQYVFNKTEFIQSFSQVGYDLIDLWEDRNDGCFIPTNPEYSVPVYYGLYLKLREQAE